MSKKIFINKIQVAILTILTVFVMCSATWAATYYVDSSVGSSGNGSQNSPWKYISNVSGVSAGDTILFKRGRSWNETLSPVSGASGNVVTYGAYEFDSNMPSIRNFKVDGKSYIKVQDIEFKSNGSNFPVLITNSSHHITIKDSTIISDTSCTTYAALRIMNSSHHNQVINCLIENRNTSIENDCFSLKFDRREYYKKGYSLHFLFTWS